MQQIDMMKLYKEKRFLVIDDYSEIRGSIKRMLNKFGAIEVDTSHNGEDAMEKCEENDYDIILSDFNLGGKKSGQQVLEEMRHRGLIKYTALYMMITAETTRDCVYSAIENQPDSYLAKPFTPPELRKRLDVLLMSKKELADINKAADCGEYETAITLCKEKIKLKDRYKTQCMKLMGRLMQLTGKHDEAKQMYGEVLAEHEPTWARIGVGKAMLGMGELDAAEDVFRALIDEDCPVIEVYDELAMVLNDQGKSLEAQALLEKAITISPDSVPRQQKMAALAEVNDDLDRAEKAHRNLCRIGQHSVHEKPENFFEYVHCMNKMANASGGGDKKRFDLAKEALNKVGKRFAGNDAVKVQTLYIQSEIESAKNNEAAAEQFFKKAEESYAKVADSLPPEVTLDRVKALSENGQKDKAKEILENLAKQFTDNPNLLRKIDNCLDEPVSSAGKEKMIEFNKEGKKLFDAKEFKSAIDYFNRALQIYPNHMALNLNLAMAILKEINASGEKDELLVGRCQRIVDKLKETENDNQYYKLLRGITKQVSEL